jgi:integrase
MDGTNSSRRERRQREPCAECGSASTRHRATCSKSESRERRLTETWLRANLGKRRSAREEWGDSDKPGLRVRFGKSGSVSWVHYRSVAGKSEVLVLGRYPDLGLGAARQRLDEERSRARQGLAGVAIPEPYDEMTVGGLVAKFSASLRAHRKHPARAERELERFVLDRGHGFRHLKVRDVARPAWHAIVEEIAAAGHATQAAKIHKLLGQMFNFALQLGVLEASPFQGLRPRALGAIEPPPRQRVLSPDELQALLEVLEGPGAADARPGRLALLLLLLTGKRTGELLRARWGDVDLEELVWTIPEANRKAIMSAAVGDEAVPLSPRAAQAFEQLRALAGEEAKPEAWVFRTPHSSATGRLGDTALARAVRELLKGAKLKMPAWTPHDLRRTARSYWSEKLGVPWDLSERLLGHALPKVARTYDTGTYLEQRRAALEKWGVYLEQLRRGDGRVAFLPAAGGAR